VKHADLNRHLQANGCHFVREGTKHTVYRNAAAGKHSTIPRHREIKDGLVRKICRDREIPRP
jgi:predicted RNA binding protein YcfA (HicA-like mRNA interferase family)